MDGSGEMHEERLQCAVRGYHVYRFTWEPYLGDDFSTAHERNNGHDKYAVAVFPVDCKERTIVGHLPREISKVSCLFLLRGGIISGVVTGRRRKTAESCGGIEVPCELIFKHRRSIVLRLKQLIEEQYTPREPSAE